MIAGDFDIPVVATNDAIYHSRERYRLQHALATTGLTTNTDQAPPFINPNHLLRLKSPERMAHFFRDCPDAIVNTLRVAERCSFNLATALGYTLPNPAVPEGYTAGTYL